jgi:TolB-like protein
MTKIAPGLAILALVALGLGCSPKVLRGGEGTENPNLDQPALSTSLDKADLDYLVKQNLGPLFESRFWTRDIEGKPGEPVVAIWPIQNATSEHLEDQMLQLLSSIETTLVNSGEVRVVARARQEQLAQEIHYQSNPIFDPEAAQRLGRQLGAQYLVTGKLTGVDERLEKTRRIQYSLFLQVLEVETGIVKFQNESARSKAIQR